MENIYIIIIGVLFLLAITDLIVGVSNDAVNFLVAAIGSKAGSFRMIMLMASLGVLVGATFSDGMMEVARKGIFHPDKFIFEEIILIFLAVMLTDIILLDFFNTFGFPTSTTVSLVFELLGAAVAISIFKVAKEGVGNVADYINSSKALAIIGGILVSVVIAFTVGAIIQWLARILFSFNYEKPYKYFGAIWGSIAITAIFFFMFMKGLGHSKLTEEPVINWILSNKLKVLAISFVGWLIIFQLLISLFKVNVLKIVVLVGTFALAMAFAGNDLVNFIGVPLAGYSAYDLFTHGKSMSELSGPTYVDPIFLIIAGLIMTLTLWTSKKARSVTETSVNLSRQNSGYERFGSSMISRALVRWAISTGQALNKVIPQKLSDNLEKRFIPKKYKKDEDQPAFDLIRASVTLVVSSILIALATSLKLPLSTTYVTFMVTMGTSLSDKAWGRESAVYRVSGVISVISGWFFTAFVAFVVSFIIATIIFFGSTFAIGILVALDVFLIYRSRLIHKKRLEKEEQEIAKLKEEQELSEQDIFDATSTKIYNEVKKVNDFINSSYKGFKKQDRKALKKSLKNSYQIKQDAKELKHDIFNTVQRLKADYLLSAQYYVQIVDAVREVANAVSFLGEMLYTHIDNNHELFSESQMESMDELKKMVSYVTKECLISIEKNNTKNIDELRSFRNNILLDIERVKKQELQIIQKDQTDIINSELYLNILSEYKNITIYIIRVVKAYRKFYLSGKKTMLMSENK